MIALDTNILVYAHRKDSPFHERAFAVVEGLANGSVLWALPWPCIYEFLSIVTHPKIYSPSTKLEQALAQVEAWFSCPSLVMLGESEKYWPVQAALLRNSMVVGPQVHDARIAALCQHHGVTELLSADRHFGRFVGLKTRNPLMTN